ncbi:MAG: hypothetical protein FJ096_14940 [Deltaproteobacteria bacterium]|nr:hypothetical protein [Deltaproteobacteria bacterium]
MSAAARLRLGWLVALSLAGTGCNAARAMVATPSDYADYRRVRLGESLDDRLAAAWDYLKARPEGRYAARLNNFFQAAEPVYFRVRSGSAAGLEAYLVALPDGPHAEEAHERLLGKRNEQRREDYGERSTRAALLRVETDSRARSEAAKLVGDWVRAMLAPAVWSRTFADAPGDVLARFRLAYPEPTCVRTDGDERCTKEVTRRFRIRGPEGDVERELRLEVELNLDRNYRVVAIALSGQNLALATAEARSGSVATERGRVEGWRGFVDALAARAFDDGRPCTSSEEAGGAYRLVCDEPRVTLTATRDGEGHETLLLARTP